MTIVSDKGSETGMMIEFQTTLRFALSLSFLPNFRTQACIPLTSGRRDAAPEIPEDEFKPWLQVQSKHNTPIEGFWPWLREGEGHNIREVILGGAAKFDPNDPLHV